MRRLLFVALTLTSLTRRWTTAHGRMVEPPARNTMWRYGYTSKPPYDDSAMLCGGFREQWRENGGKCGVCGDNWQLEQPRPHETGGKYWHDLVPRSYSVGGNVDIVLDLNANHWGWHEFSLCPLNEYTQLESEECFDGYLLELSDGSGTRAYGPRNRTATVYLQVKLPEGVTCRKCVFRWHWKSANNWGKCEDGKPKMGCGPQETYRNCADISIYDDTTSTRRRRRYYGRRLNSWHPYLHRPHFNYW